MKKNKTMNKTEAQKAITTHMLKAEELAIEHELPLVAVFDKDHKIIISKDQLGNDRHALELLDKEISN
jgi:hypothetical protein